MTQEQIQINNIFKKFGINLMVNGIQMIAKTTKLTPTQKSFGNISTSYKNAGLSISTGEKDTDYFFTNWDNWDKMLDVIWDIIKNFKWVAQKFDCDNRAHLVTALCSLFFGVNTCGTAYCERITNATGYKVRHYTNIVITNNGNLYLFDVDNKGDRVRILKGQPTVMNGKTYKFLSASYF